MRRRRRRLKMSSTATTRRRCARSLICPATQFIPWRWRPAATSEGATRPVHRRSTRQVWASWWNMQMFCQKKKINNHTFFFGKSSPAAPCSPEILNLVQTNISTYRVFVSMPNSPGTTYSISASGHDNMYTCQTKNSSCELTQLPCGSTYEVMAVATAAEGASLPGFTKTLETGTTTWHHFSNNICNINHIYVFYDHFVLKVQVLSLNQPPEVCLLYPSTRAPCCPAAINVSLVTQAMTNVSWSPGGGARYYMVSLTSLRGHAKCHTLDTHCLMGCITCSTSYSVNLEAISSTGHKSECPYRGFSSSKEQLQKRFDNISSSVPLTKKGCQLIRSTSQLIKVS